jgi:sucrose-6-phosphate hydrolase SacC (GH32 family)
MSGRDPSFGAKHSAGEWECPECSCINVEEDEICWQCGCDENGNIIVPDSEDTEDE